MMKSENLRTTTRRETLKVLGLGSASGLLGVFGNAPQLMKRLPYMSLNEVPGLGVDVNEKLAAKYPIPEKQLNEWTQLRKRDGTATRP